MMLPTPAAIAREGHQFDMFEAAAIGFNGGQVDVRIRSRIACRENVSRWPAPHFLPRHE